MERQAEAEFSRLLERMPEPYRQLLWLLEIGGYSKRDAARVLELSEPTIDMMTRRARRRFKALFLAQEMVTGPAPALLAKTG